MFKNTLKTLKFALTDNRALGLIAFGVLAVIVAWNTVGVLQQNYDLEKKIAAQRRTNEIAKLENENQKLRNTYYASSEYAELTARRQLGKAAPGERLYLIPRGLSEAASVEVLPTIQDTTVTKKDKNKYIQNLEAWIDFFKGKQADTPQKQSGPVIAN